LGKTKIDLEEEINAYKKIKITKQFLRTDINRVLENMKKLKSEMTALKGQKNEKDELLLDEKNIKKLEHDEAEKLEDRKIKLIKKVDHIKDNIVEMKNLRETILRTVARLEENTRYINEEIQIKELIYLEMTKKSEELRNQYQTYHKKYEIVLAERNRNVAKIQNAHQRKAEFKEKMKILSTEMDILQSELSEINEKLSDKQKYLSKIKQRQTALKQEINKDQYEYKTYEEEIKKLTNENEKLHTILSSLENDMVTLRVDYELACESRNFTGIQLIDRNDELCIFYEKVQHLESEINELNKKIMSKETHIQKLVIDNQEVERFIEVNRKKMPQIPELSNKIKELDVEIKLLNTKLDGIIAEIEDPESPFKNELPGEDPDLDYLKMKYDQLSEMLNSKKEQLLEKELVNEEINEIADKLKEKALGEREKNLEINEKVRLF
jgi:chromosome segregation ATPase